MNNFDIKAVPVAAFENYQADCINACYQLAPNKVELAAALAFYTDLTPAAWVEVHKAMMGWVARNGNWDDSKPKLTDVPAVNKFMALPEQVELLAELEKAKAA